MFWKYIIINSHSFFKVSYTSSQFEELKSKLPRRRKYIMDLDVPPYELTRRKRVEAKCMACNKTIKLAELQISVEGYFLEKSGWKITPKYFCPNKQCLQGRMVAYDLAIPPFEGQKIRTNGTYSSLGIGEKLSDLTRYKMEDFVIDDTIY